VGDIDGALAGVGGGDRGGVERERSALVLQAFQIEARCLWPHRTPGDFVFPLVAVQVVSVPTPESRVAPAEHVRLDVDRVSRVHGNSAEAFGGCDLLCRERWAAAEDDGGLAGPFGGDAEQRGLRERSLLRL